MSDGRERITGEALGELIAGEVAGLRVRLDEPLASHSSLRIGGPATVWAEVGEVEALQRLVTAARADGYPVYVVGLGSNVLFPDEGLEAVVVRLVDGLAEIDIDDDDDEALVSIGGGAVNAHIVRKLHKEGWVGAEFLALIPGTFGGAVVMNAGTKERELCEVLVDAELVEPSDKGVEQHTYGVDELGLTYRHSEVEPDAIVLGGRIRVRRGDVEEARRKVRRDRERRDRTQPYKLASVGSTFANPPDDYAGRLIDEVGLKGHSVGGARISEHHANFFINEDEASAEDFLELMALAQSQVQSSFGVELRPEVRFVGFDGHRRLRELRERYRDAC
ncbi:MAG: UDP-N-acetylmuramate dehydrogenase [Persicimonas sp.]